MTDDPLACPHCPFVGATVADLYDHRLIKRFTDPAVHADGQNEKNP